MNIKAKLDGVACEVIDFFTDEAGKSFVTVRATEFKSFNREVAAERIEVVTE